MLIRLLSRMGVLLAAGAALVVWAQAQDAAATANLVRNAGFEDGTDGPTGWHLGMEGRGAGSATWVQGDVHSGDRCARVELTESGDYWMADQMMPKGTASHDRLYRLSGWYRSSAAGVAHPTVYSLDAEGGFLGAFEFSLPAADEWTLFDTVFRPRPGVDHFRLQLRVQGTPGVVWYDDVTLADGGAIAEHQQSLAARLDADAAGLEGWWCALLPGESAMEVRLRGVRQVQVAMKAVGRVATATQPFAGVEVESKGARVAIPVLKLEPGGEGPDAPPVGKLVDLTAQPAVDWRGSVLLRLVGRGLGQESRLLVAVKPTPEIRSGLVDAKLWTAYESPSGEPVPWAPRFVGEARAAIERVAGRNLYRHLRDLLGAKPGQAAALALDGLTKRRPEQWREDLTTGALKPTSAVDLLCAGGETESFQCLFVPTSSSPRELTAEMTPLRGEDGAELGPEACKIHLVGYVPFGEEWLPDPLLESQPFEASELGPPVFWVTVSVPGGQKPGVYRGRLQVRAAGAGEGNAEVRVRVPAFSLPRETHVNSSFWLFRAQIRRYFDLAEEPSAEEYGKYVGLATSHRLSPIDVLEGPCEPLVKVYREADGSLSYDWTRWDGFLQRALAGGANTVHAAWTHHMGYYFSDRRPVEAVDRATGEKVKLAPPHLSEEHLRYLGGYVRAAAEHVRALGFKGVVYVQPYDEPQPQAYEMVTKTLVGLGKYAAGVPRLMDAVYPPRLPGDLRENIDLWCPLSPGIPGNDFEKEQAAGDILWWYVCCGPRGQYANFFTNQTVLENRMLFTQTWQHQVTGVLYWGLNYWISWGAPVPQPRFPEGPWVASTTAEGAYHGDGYFIYPGPTPGEPLSSVRLETLRDGVEDYEYLHLLGELAEGRDVPAEVRELLAVPAEVSSTLTDFTRDPEVFRRYRERLAYWIEKLGR